MATMNVSLPDQMKIWVEENVRSGRYANASDYMRDLIRRDKERDVTIEQVQKLLTEGLESGTSDATVEDVLARVKARRAAEKIAPADGA